MTFSFSRNLFLFFWVVNSMTHFPPFFFRPSSPKKYRLLRVGEEKKEKIPGNSLRSFLGWLCKCPNSKVEAVTSIVFLHSIPGKSKTCAIKQWPPIRARKKVTLNHLNSFDFLDPDLWFRRCICSESHWSAWAESQQAHPLIPVIPSSPKNPSTVTTNETRIGGFLPPQFKNMSQLNSVMFPRFEVEKNIVYIRNHHLTNIFKKPGNHLQI